MSDWDYYYYYGCIDPTRLGHYLWLPDEPFLRITKVMVEGWPKHLWGTNGSGLDAKYAPSGPEKQSLARIAHVGEWTVLAIWDRSSDSRPGSNSAFITNSECNFSAMCARAAEHFPTVWKRINDAAPVVEWKEEER